MNQKSIKNRFLANILEFNIQKMSLGNSFKTNNNMHPFSNAKTDLMSNLFCLES